MSKERTGLSRNKDKEDQMFDIFECLKFVIAGLLN